MTDYQLRTVNLADLPPTEGVRPDSTFIKSIKHLGIVEPVVLNHTDDGYTIIDGNRRIAGLRATGVTDATIDAKVYTDCDGPTIDVLTLTLNEQRGENFATQTNAILRLDTAGMTKPEIVHATGMSKAKVERHLYYANTPGILFDAFCHGFISATVMDSISRCTPEEQDTLAVIFSGKGRVTSTDVRTVREATSATLHTEDTVIDAQVVTDPRPVSYADLRTAINVLAEQAHHAGFTYDQMVKLLAESPAYSLAEAS